MERYARVVEKGAQAVERGAWVVERDVRERGSAAVIVVERAVERCGEKFGARYEESILGIGKEGERVDEGG